MRKLRFQILYTMSGMAENQYCQLHCVRQCTRHPACMNTPVQENCTVTINYMILRQNLFDYLMIIIAILLMILHEITVLFSGEDLILLVREF